MLLAGSPLVESFSGKYFDDCQEAFVVDERGPGPFKGVARYAVDDENICASGKWRRRCYPDLRVMCVLVWVTSSRGVGFQLDLSQFLISRFTARSSLWR